jgi:hypothetical protein
MSHYSVDFPYYLRCFKYTLLTGEPHFRPQVLGSEVCIRFSRGSFGLCLLPLPVLYHNIVGLVAVVLTEIIDRSVRYSDFFLFMQSVRVVCAVFSHKHNTYEENLIKVT